MKNVYSNISKEENIALRELSKDENIVVLKSDKTNQVVIMNKTDYINKSMNILQDQTKFKKLNNDPTKTRENKLNTLLLKMKKGGEINEEQYQAMRSTGASPGKFYGLPKTHKSGVPLRPIISNCGTYNYNVAKYLTKLLTSESVNEFSHVKDSFDFVENMRKIQIMPNTEMASFDVESLFTNVPTLETIDVIIKDIYDNENKTKVETKISSENMRRLLKLCTQ
jgi:hypothetical protein